MEKIYASSLLFVILFIATFTIQLANATIPAIYIFGDSTADVGTNTYIPGSKARADFPFNGVDFTHSRPTGRFSNGLNSADFLAKLMGFKRSPQPYLFLLSLPSGLKRHKHRGVNFASGGAGLLDVTNEAMKVVSLTKQIEQFIIVHNNRVAITGPNETETMLSKSLFCISVGSNDIFSYFSSNRTIPPDLFIANLMLQYEAYIKTLYNFGARKFGIISIPPIGCCPAQKLFNATGGCLEGMNDFARAFHFALDNLLRKISSELPEMKYSLGNSYEMTINIIQNPAPFNFKDVETACCGAGRLNAETPCNRTANLCANRNEYLFWDLFHPTQNASQLAAVTLYDGPTKFVTPINFRQLAEDN
ncbi:GDSL esterase/lipase [Camellia lanceoleosa]|uniref:GDSL esterase/lipase n=1 Tax=Camellia lanceoleosa TaxID=1840588 RepID=A0ACC0I857_9ERIC|nr:GDSL esterase/lipase [Camellia lanceoleosa]